MSPPSLTTPTTPASDTPGTPKALPMDSSLWVLGSSHIPASASAGPSFHAWAGCDTASDCSNATSPSSSNPSSSTSPTSSSLAAADGLLWEGTQLGPWALSHLSHGSSGISEAVDSVAEAVDSGAEIDHTPTHAAAEQPASSAAPAAQPIAAEEEEEEEEQGHDLLNTPGSPPPQHMATSTTGNGGATPLVQAALMRLPAKLPPASLVATPAPPRTGAAAAATAPIQTRASTGAISNGSTPLAATWERPTSTPPAVLAPPFPTRAPSGAGAGAGAPQASKAPAPASTTPAAPAASAAVPRSPFFVSPSAPTTVKPRATAAPTSAPTTTTTTTTRSSADDGPRVPSSTAPSSSSAPRAPLTANVPVPDSTRSAPSTSTTSATHATPAAKKHLSDAAVNAAAVAAAAAIEHIGALRKSSLVGGGGSTAAPSTSPAVDGGRASQGNHSRTAAPHTSHIPRRISCPLLVPGARSTPTPSTTAAAAVSRTRHAASNANAGSTANRPVSDTGAAAMHSASDADPVLLLAQAAVNQGSMDLQTALAIAQIMQQPQGEEALSAWVLQQQQQQQERQQVAAGTASTFSTRFLLDSQDCAGDPSFTEAQDALLPASLLLGGGSLGAVGGQKSPPCDAHSVNPANTSSVVESGAPGCSPLGISSLMGLLEQQQQLQQQQQQQQKNANPELTPDLLQALHSLNLGLDSHQLHLLLASAGVLNSAEFNSIEMSSGGGHSPTIPSSLLSSMQDGFGGTSPFSTSTHLSLSDGVGTPGFSPEFGSFPAASLGGGLWGRGWSQALESPSSWGTSSTAVAAPSASTNNPEWVHGDDQSDALAAVIAALGSNSGVCFNNSDIDIGSGGGGGATLAAQAQQLQSLASDMGAGQVGMHVGGIHQALQRFGSGVDTSGFAPASLTGVDAAATLSALLAQQLQRQRQPQHWQQQTQLHAHHPQHRYTPGTSHYPRNSHSHSDLSAVAAAAAAATTSSACTAHGGRVGKGWEDLSAAVREKVVLVAERCRPCVKLSHFDAGVRHWLVQLTTLFGEAAALSGLSAIESATNLEGVRNMRAFITTRLIDHYEQLVFSRDPEGYARRRLLPDQYLMLHELISSGQGLQWSHFDPKVLETVRDMGCLEYTRARLQRLSAKELATVQNVPAYIFTLLSKRGRTAKQAAAAKTAAELAFAALSPAAGPSPTASLASAMRAHQGAGGLCGEGSPIHPFHAHTQASLLGLGRVGSGGLAGALPMGPRAHSSCNPHPLHPYPHHNGGLGDLTAVGGLGGLHRQQSAGWVSGLPPPPPPRQHPLSAKHKYGSTSSLYPPSSLSAAASPFSASSHQPSPTPNAFQHMHLTEMVTGLSAQPPQQWGCPSPAPVCSFDTPNRLPSGLGLGSRTNSATIGWN